MSCSSGYGSCMVLSESQFHEIFTVLYVPFENRTHNLPSILSNWTRLGLEPTTFWMKLLGFSTLPRAIILAFFGTAANFRCEYIAGDWIKSSIKLGHFQGSGNEIRGFGPEMANAPESI